MLPEVCPKARDGLAPTFDSSCEAHRKVRVQNWRPKLLNANKHKNFKKCPKIVICLLTVQRGEEKKNNKKKRKRKKARKQP